MVRFGNDESNPLLENFTVTIEGCKCTYIQTLKALVEALAACNKEALTDNEFYSICNLIACMLPDETQVLNPEEVKLFEELKKVKQQN